VLNFKTKSKNGSNSHQHIITAGHLLHYSFMEN